MFFRFFRGFSPQADPSFKGPEHFASSAIKCLFFLSLFFFPKKKKEDYICSSTSIKATTEGFLILVLTESPVFEIYSVYGGRF